jgi:hypothetical protein
MSKIIDLYGMPYEVMLIVEHGSGVMYENQAGGTLCLKPSIEGVLAPVNLEPDQVEQIMNLPYEPRRGISAEVADGIDAVLAAAPRARYLKVDRARLADSLEAWVFVTAEISNSDVRRHDDVEAGCPRGFGRSTGVLTWINSD